MGDLLVAIVNTGMKLFSNRMAIWTLVIGLIVGLVLGWFVIGWGLWPLEWTDAAPVDLSSRFGYQQQYLLYAANYYASNPDPQALKEMLAERWTPKQAAGVVDKMIQNPKYVVSKPKLEMLSNALKALPEEKPAKAGGANWLMFCGAALVIALLLVVGVRVVLPRLAGGGMPEAGPVKATVPSTGTAGKIVEPEAWVGEETKPISQFVTTYQVGDNRYDMSFSIESGADFLGECGVAISETIGVGDPDKATALEVWLFDKNDIRTITKVLMSEYCYGDATLRAKLASKGEAVLIQPDVSVELDTQTLRLRARVVDMEYGAGGLPPRSFFNRVTLELAAWPKSA